MLLYCINQSTAFKQVMGERFFAVDIFAMTRCKGADIRVPVVGGAYHDGINVGSTACFTIVFDHLAVGILVFIIDALFGLFHFGGIYIADHLDVNIIKS
jgi:hypothetical protein